MLIETYKTDLSLPPPPMDLMPPDSSSSSAQHGARAYSAGRGVKFATSSPFIPAPSDDRPIQPGADAYLPDGMDDVDPDNKRFREPKSKLLTNENFAKLGNKWLSS